MERYSEYKDSGVKWLGEIPSHWDPSRNKAIFRETKAVVGKNSKNFTLLSLTKKGVIVRNLDEGGKYPAEFDTYKIVEPGDFIFCFFDVDETPRAIGLSTNKGMITGAYTVLKQNTANSRYLYYYYLSIDDAKALKPLYSGLRKTVPLASFMSMPIFLPPRAEQDAIVRYLDAATSKIDKAIAMQQKMIDLLNERKQIIIQNAVTKGLDENVEMKDSGVEWIGMIPKNWEVRKIKSVALFNPLPQKKFQPDDIIGYLPMDRLGFGKMKPSEIKYGKMPVGLNYFEDGDIVMAKVTPCFENGKIAIADNLKNGCAYGTSEIFVYRPISSVSSKFILYSLQNEKLKSVFASTMMGTGGLKRINAIFAKNAQIALPTSIDEQKNIVSFLDEKICMFDSAISNCQRQITLLQERKQIIINEVVTGKVKVS